MAAPLGSGGRFKAMVASGKSPALAAWIGRKKYGAEGMAALSHHGEGGASAARRAVAMRHAARRKAR